MPSQSEELLSVDQFFLSVYMSSLIGKNIEVPNYSRQVLRAVFNRAFEQTFAIRKNNPSLDAADALLTTFLVNLGLERQGESPIILIDNHQAEFSTAKKPPYSITVVQPRFPHPSQFEEMTSKHGKLVLIKQEAFEALKKEVIELLRKLHVVDRLDFLCLPELSFLNEKEVTEAFAKFADEKNCFVIAGSFHDHEKETNTCLIFLPRGAPIRQNKIFRAQGEGIRQNEIEFLHEVDFKEGRFCVLICIDSEREAIRQVLKERLETQKCPVLVFNPSHTEHPRRSIGLLTNNLMILISAAIVFCNTNKKGGSTVLAPFVELKDKNFEMFKLPSSDETLVQTAEVDIVPLLKNRQDKQDGVVSATR